MSSAALKSVGAALVGVTTYMMFFRTPQQNLVRADSSNRKLVRRHSSGDHAFLPTKQDRKAIKEANKNVRRIHTLISTAPFVTLTAVPCPTHALPTATTCPTQRR